MKNLLITQCLQNDFVKPLASGESLPNQLHVGYRESHRLVGSDPQNGPVARFMQWAEKQGREQLALVHIRDWHNPSHPDQLNHLEQFGHHCIQETAGADFIFSGALEYATLINSTTLNDFEGTALHETLAALVDKTPHEKIRVGLIGVWTEAKILFLAYELSTRYPQFDIAVCSALTASSSRSQHFFALQQLERIVGVKVIDSIGEFIQFLGGEETIAHDKNWNQALTIQTSEAITTDEETDLLIRYLFRDCKMITLKVLDGGFSGNLVAGVTSIDLQGHEQTQHVIKIGPRDLMAKERIAFEQIEMILGNNAPAIAEYADGQGKGAIKYRYASMGSGKARSLQSCFHAFFNGEINFDVIERYLKTVFNEQLAKLYRAAISDKHDLYEYYCFDAKWAESVKNKIETLIDYCPEQDDLILPGGQRAANVYYFYRERLNRLPSMVADFPFAFVHGDLNGANVIIDAKDNTWLIDFFHTHRGHVLKDFAKLENDVLYIYTPVDDEASLAMAHRFTDFFVKLSDPFDDLPELPSEFMNTPFEKTWQVIRMLRQLAGQYIASDAVYRKEQWLIPQLRYAVHTIGFDEPNRWQRIWALYTASVLTNLI